MTPERAIVGLWLAWVVSWAIAAFWSNRTEKWGGVAGEVVFRLLFWVGAILLLVPLPNRLSLAQMQVWRLNGALKWTLAGLTATGLVFTWWARIHLGRLWSAIVTKKAGHHVVDTGPYRLVRHPIYSGLIFAALATAAEKGTSYALSGGAVLAIAFYMKARREERFLRAELGEGAYDAYAHKTPMLMPLSRGRGKGDEAEC